MSQASPSVPTSFARGRHVPPLCRQQQHLVLVSENHKINIEISIILKRAIFWAVTPYSVVKV
jgi:hypothetical protein